MLNLQRMVESLWQKSNNGVGVCLEENFISNFCSFVVAMWIIKSNLESYTMKIKLNWWNTKVGIQHQPNKNI